MPEFVPFPAIRYAAAGDDHDLSAVCAPPYDVIEPDERVALLAADAHNAVRLILPDSYPAAAASLAAWLADGTLVAEHVPSFSLYRMHAPDGPGGRPTVTTGVLGALALDRDRVLPHERTLPKAKSDRLELLRATRANLDPIWALSLAPRLSGLLEPDGPPLAFAIDAEGVRHEVFPVRDPARLDAISTVVSAARLVLADGHHRFETACTYAEERGPRDRGAAAIMALVVELAPEQLWVRAIHRLLGDVPPGAARAAVALLFDVRDAGVNDADGVARLEATMRREGALGFVDGYGLAALVPTAALDRSMAALPPPLRDVDAARFDSLLPALPAGVSVSYRHDAAAVAAAVRKGEAQAAVLLRPVDVATIRAAADAGVRMPEKTTFFAPKPRTGMVLRSLDR